VRACVRACVRVRVRACVRACVHMQSVRAEMERTIRLWVGSSAVCSSVPARLASSHACTVLLHAAPHRTAPTACVRACVRVLACVRACVCARVLCLLVLARVHVCACACVIECVNVGGWGEGEGRVDVEGGGGGGGVALTCGGDGGRGLSSSGVKYSRCRSTLCSSLASSHSARTYTEQWPAGESRERQRTWISRHLRGSCV
jgi:hypothetical protein